MNIEAIATVVNRNNIQPFSSAHAKPVSARLNQWTINLLTDRKGVGISILKGLASGVISPFITCFAIAEVVASFVYNLFAILVILPITKQAPNLDAENHLVKAWAYLRHTALMVASPFWQIHAYVTGYGKLQGALHQLNCVQAAQSLGNATQLFGPDVQKGYQRMVMTTLEIFPKIINQVNAIENPNQIDPGEPVNSQDLKLCIRDSIRVRNNDEPDLIILTLFRTVVERMRLNDPYAIVKRISNYVVLYKRTMQNPENLRLQFNQLEYQYNIINQNILRLMFQAERNQQNDLHAELFEIHREINAILGHVNIMRRAGEIDENYMRRFQDNVGEMQQRILHMNGIGNR